MKYLFVLFFILLTISSASAELVSIGDSYTAVGSEVTVPVMINGSGNVAGGVVNISFDPSIVSVKNIVAGDFGDPVANINNTHGWVKFVVARVYNVNKNESVLANIVFNGSITGFTGVNLTYAILNNESGQLITPTIKNGSVEVLLSPDAPPSSITDLRSTVGDTWINWTWTNPIDADFNHTKIYFDATFVADSPENHFNATGLLPATIHTISTHTADIKGNINQTWVNNTAVTYGYSPDGLKINILKPQNYSIIPAGEKLTIQINVTDLAGNPVTSDILSIADLSGPNGASRQVLLSEDAGNFSGEYLVSEDDPSGIWAANITAYNSTASGKASVRLLFTGAYIIQPYSRSHSYLIGDIANFTARVAKPGSSPQILTDQNLSLNFSVYLFNTSTPVIGSIEMEFNDTSNIFYGSIDTGSIGPGLFNIVFKGNDTSGNSETAELLIGVTDDFVIELETEKAFYDRDEAVNISGIVKYLNNSPLENISVNLKIDLHGFKRSYSVTTNETGHFNYSFNPFDTEAGNYSIRAEASNLGLLRFAERNFTIHGLYLIPQSATIEMVEDSTRTINFTLYNLGDTAITGISSTLNDLDISDKVTATIDTVPSELQPYQSATIRIQINAETPVPDAAKFNIEITSDQNSNEISELNVKLFKPDPILKVYPSEIITGLNKNQTQIETVAIYNMGYGVLRNVTLHQPDNNWTSITSNTSIGDLPPGENATFDIHINSYNVDTGIYRDQINITSDNHHEVQVNVTAFVNELTNGSLLFHVTDALERNLSNTNISLINQDTYDEFASSTNSTGYALMADLPTGRYIFEVSSDGTNTLPQMGTIEVEPMDTPKLIEIALYMSFIDFDWEVTPTSIQDYYNVILKMRFETDVPIPLLLANPPYIQYNMAAGQEKMGSFALYNVGLVSAYNVTISPINYNGITLDPLVTTVDEIRGKSNVQIPYRIKIDPGAANCQELSGKINIQGRYVHFINNHEVISYIGTSIPVMVRTPVDETCKLELNIPFPDYCINFDGLKFGTQKENLDVDPSTIWILTGEWGEVVGTNELTLPDVSDATNNNEIGDIKLSEAIGITFSFGIGDIIESLTGMPVGFDVVGKVLEKKFNIPYFNGIWLGDFDTNLIVPEQNSSLDIKRLPTGVGVTLPELMLGGLLFQFGNSSCYNCFWILPMAGFDYSVPTIGGLPHFTIYIPQVHLVAGSGGGGSSGGWGSDSFCWNCVPDIFIVPTLPHFSGITFVPWDWPEWNWHPGGGDPIRPKPKPRVTQTIHEVVELSISQNVTMERDAFWAGLGIRNRLPDKNINNVRVDLHIKDNSGSANDKFFIQAPRLNGISSIDGSGVISPLALARSQWLIIPKTGAGGVDPEGVKYNISANISYSVDGVNFEISTQEIEILVKPQPEIVLDYFIPSDVIANKPFKLAVKVTNEGHGEARNFAIETAQPVIYYNPSGLLLDFEIIRSQLQGEERSSSMKVDFGDIQPGDSKIAWWDMVTSIDGTFTKFTGEYTHSSELGGMETSLIKKINTYIIQKQMGSGELGYDFLANSQDNETHYMLFNSSTGSSTFVINASYTVVNMPEPDNPVLDLSIEDYTGDWVIVSILDPYNNAVPIEKVIRTRDGTEIPSYNYWMRNGRILIVDRYDAGFDGKYSIIYSGMPEPGITVTSPNGGEAWYISNTYPIKWVYAGDLGSNVKIELLNSEGSTIDIVSSTSIGSDGVGTYNWKIPLDLVPGTEYQVTVMSTTNSYYNDISDGHFIIELPSTPKIISGPRLNMTNDNSVIIKWETDISSNSTVNYGKSPLSYENGKSNPSFDTKHEIEIVNIDYQQTYYYRLSSFNEFGDKFESDEYNFKFIASPSIDGYQFPNYPIEGEDLSIMFWDSMFSSLNPIELPIYNTFKVLVSSITQFGGHCFGMTTTSILYFENEIDKPIGYEEGKTIEILKNDARYNIDYYQATQLSTKSAVDILFFGIFDRNWNGHGQQEFQKIKNSIDENKPLWMHLRGNAQHAVTPIGYSTGSNSDIIYIYDNSLPYQTREIEVTQNYIEYIDNPYWNEQKIRFDKFLSFNPEKKFEINVFKQMLKFFSNQLKGKLGDIKSYIITLACPADLRIVDQHGRVITTFNGDTNEIPNASLNSGEEFEIYNLPSDLMYTIEMIGTGNGDADLSFSSKDIILTFNDIPITSLTRGKMYIGRTNSYILSLDNNNDGIIDEYISPIFDTYTEDGYNITFLPPISTKESFNLTDGSILPIKFTTRNRSTDEFIYDSTVNVTIINSTGQVITYFTNGTGTNSVGINSIDEQYSVDFNTNDYPELIIGEPYSLQVTFGDIDNLQGYAMAYFTLIEGTPPSSISNLHPTPGPTWINFTWLNPPDPDFNHTILYLNGAFLTNVPAPQNYYNITGLMPDTEYEIGTHTADTSGNVNQTWVNKTARTAPLSELLSSTISLKSGWNLISVPIDLTTWKLGDESNVGKPIYVTPANCILSIYRYNTTSELFEKSDHFEDWGWWPATGSESFTALEPGRGYWIMAQQDCNLTFTGAAPSGLDIPIKSGWNLIGWYSMNEAQLGEESVVGNPLNVTPANSLTSIYRYNTTSALFEKSDHFLDWGWWPATGSEGFSELEPGRGYWMDAKNIALWNNIS
ncbi:MAG: cohesin domain-containing protein [Candidatus Methanoperedens sp.]|nr:cohesin domain-containing protein [Candidatus Methanoperedens sp.]